MRNVFAEEITAIAQTDPRVMLLSGDIGNRLFDRFKQHARDRFINCGIAEANMMGMAAGLALNGFRPFVYTITPFTTVRCLEQIRIDVCYHKAPVIIVGTGSGLSYAELGPTHHSCEDVAILRVLPEMKVLCPADSAELRSAIAAALAQDAPIYIRLGKKGEPKVHDAPPPDFTIGRAITVRDGVNVCLLGTGNTVSLAVEAARLLEQRGISARVESFHTVKPLDEARLDEVFSTCRTIAIVEEHSRIAGLGGAVAEWALRRGGTIPRVLTFGTPDEFPHFIGSQAYLRERFGMSPKDIADAISAG